MCQPCPTEKLVLLVKRLGEKHARRIGSTLPASAGVTTEPKQPVHDLVALLGTTEEVSFNARQIL